MRDETIDGESRAAWDVIDETCAARFTGELTLTTAAGTTNVYMTRGLIYLAEDSAADPIGQRLARAGVIPGELLDGEDSDGSSSGRSLADLDALFADQPISSRADAEAAIQAETETVLLEVSEQTVLASNSTMYRHHPSGIDRWFSSHHARSAPVGSGCTTPMPLDDGGAIELIPEPQLIPPLLAEQEPSGLPEDVAAAVRRAVSAIESATKTIGPAPKGFVRVKR